MSHDETKLPEIKLSNACEHYKLHMENELFIAPVKLFQHSDNYLPNKLYCPAST
jgi:hypothetical protein